MSTININSNTGMPYNYNYLSDVGLNPVVIGVIVIVIIVYFLLFSSLGSDSSAVNGSTSSSSYGMLEMLLWAVFIMLILLNGMSYFFNINIIASIKNIFSPSPQVDIVVDQGDNKPSPVPEIGYKPQVFHISDNKYNYEDAKAICKAYGGRLANYNEIEDAYKNGADWCSYGWSEGQYAYYPTQQEKWENLQKIPGHEHSCGGPKINGGFFSNPDMKFGVNCFGFKPKITPDEAQAMINTPLYPKTNKEIEFDKKVDYWRTKLNELTVAPFNHNNWSVV